MERTVPENEMAWSLITARGEDAVTFLDGQLSQSLDAATAGDVWTCVLEPDGRVLTYARVHLVADGCDLFVPSGLVEPTLLRLRKFLLRTRCTLESAPIDEEPPLSEDARWEQSWPWTAELELQLLPHAYGSRFVEHTVSFTKGCFTGQEIVGRMDARGATMPWRVVRGSGPDIATINEVFRSVGPEGPQGVTSSRETDSGVEVMGVVHRTLLSADYDATSVIFEVLP